MLAEPFFLFKMTAGDLSVTLAIIVAGQKIYSALNTRFEAIEKRVGILETDFKVTKPKVDSLWANLLSKIQKDYVYRTQVELEKQAANKGELKC
jgi:hypothetical protein